MTCDAQTALLTEAGRCLSAAEAGAKKQAKATKSAKQTGRFPPGLEWEILLADTVILNGLTSALGCAWAVRPRGDGVDGIGDATVRRTWGT
jgi:hypothetical protein